ncbi:MAG: hypothetical protein NVSMB4_14420 [Acidimicrobiales bacterium]
MNARPALDPAGLRSTTVWLDDAAVVDLLAVAGTDGWLWERDRSGFAGRGSALRIPLKKGLAGSDTAQIVADALGAIRVERDDVGLPGCGPVAVGALPFDSSHPTELRVPETTVGRTPDGRSWRTTVGVPTEPFEMIESAPQDPDGFELTSPVPHSEWMDLVAQAVLEIEARRFDKVVLAREVCVDTNRVIHVPTVLRRLRSLYPVCTVVSAPAPAGGRFIAASPELLISRLGSSVRSHPLAGTIPRSGNPEADRVLAEGLLGSAKDRAEHDWVVRDVRRVLEPLCVSLDVPTEPSIVSFRNVSHLGTLVSGTLGENRPSALALAADLHPTAAVGGTPREAALEWLGAHERLDRGPYAGPVGWVDSRGDGEWVVGIRSAVIDGNTARLFAGVGVVEGSDPASELAETQFKLQALLAAVVRP